MSVAFQPLVNLTEARTTIASMYSIEFEAHATQVVLRSILIFVVIYLGGAM